MVFLNWVFWALVGISLVLLFIWAYCLWDVLRSQFAGANDKLVWVLLILFVPALGVLFYFFMGRKQKINYQ